MDDIPPSVGIVFIICLTIITATIVVCDCVKQKYAAPDNVVTSTDSTTGVGVSTTETSNGADATSTETANAPTETSTLTKEQARRAGAALMMRAATHAATGF